MNKEMIAFCNKHDITMGQADKQGVVIRERHCNIIFDDMEEVVQYIKTLMKRYV